MHALNITAYTHTNATGHGIYATQQALHNNKSGLTPLDFLDIDLDTHAGFIQQLNDYNIDSTLEDFNCRNNLLAQFALQQDNFLAAVKQCKQKYAPHRIAIIMGTSTSGILSTELAYRNIDENGLLPEQFNFHKTHELNSLSEFVKRYLKIDGLAFTISTACSSSAKVFSEAYRLIQAGVCDAAIVGGVDSLCLTTLYGFDSLELVSPAPCKPADINRRGISLGEAGGFAILETPQNSDAAVSLAGFGESSDAYHMSTPSPDGTGAKIAMQNALARACLNPADIDYINLHGTATKSNDLSESNAISSVFGNNTSCSSTKGWTGHTLGAAGITEAIIAISCIEQNFIPQSLNTRQLDPQITINICMQAENKKVKTVLSNSFGFGGSNCSLIFSGNS